MAPALQHSFLPIARTPVVGNVPGQFPFNPGAQRVGGFGWQPGMPQMQFMGMPQAGGWPQVDWTAVGQVGLPLAATYGLQQAGRRFLLPAVSRYVPVGRVGSGTGLLAGTIIYNLSRDTLEAAGLMPGRFGQFGWNLDEALRSAAFNPEYSTWWNWAGTLGNAINTIGSPKYTAAVGYGAYDAYRTGQQALQRNLELDRMAQQAQQQGRLQHWRGHTPQQDWWRRWWRAFRESF